MAQRIAIVGAGLIGASIAHQLARRGADVTVIEAGLPGQAASGRSFGWLNASFFADEDHYRLRVAGMEAWRRLKSGLPGLRLRWPGCLWWEEQGEVLERMRRQLRDLGYPVERLSRADLARRLPDFAGLPEEALAFPSEGVAETGTVVVQLLAAARDQGARVLSGVAVDGIAVSGDRVTGLHTAQGDIAADRVIVAAGTGSPGLLAPLGVELPMLSRPGALMHTAPLPPIVSQVVVTPELELRQDADGRLIVPTSAAHQGDTTEAVTDLAGMADEAAARLRRLLPKLAADWEQVVLAMRPVPGDGLPAVGRAGPKGLYLAVMHSGATLAAIIGEIVAQELLDDVSAPMLKSYRPGRFQAG